MRRTFAALLAAVAVTTSSCAYGQGYDGFSTEEFAPNVGANETVNGVMVRNAFVIGGAEGRPLRPGADVPLFAALVSERDEPARLVSVESPGLFAGARMPGGALEVPPNEVAGGGPAPQVLLTGLTRPLRSGTYLPVTFRFENAGTVRLKVPVMPPTQWRATYSPWPASPMPASPTPSFPAPPSPPPNSPGPRPSAADA